ncbi:hypothetical protein ACWGID_28170 [Kribbella sp. NPDC054772]
MAEEPVSKAAARFVDEWEAAVRERLQEKPPERYDRRVLLGPYFSPEKLRSGVLGVGVSGGEDKGDGLRLDRLGRSTTWRKTRSWPTGGEVSKVQQLGLGLTRELSAGAGRGAARQVQDRQGQQLSDAIGSAVGRFHYPHVVDQLEAAQTISPAVARSLRSGNGWAQDTPRERLVGAFAGIVDPVEQRGTGDGRLLDRVHASERLDKAMVTAEILVNRSPVLQQADTAVRAAATERLTSVIGDQLAVAMKELDESRESQTVLKQRGDILGRRIGEDVQRAIGRLENEAAPGAAAEATREADVTAAARLAGDGVAGAGTAARAEGGPGVDPATAAKDRTRETGTALG